LTEKLGIPGLELVRKPVPLCTIGRQVSWHLQSNEALNRGPLASASGFRALSSWCLWGNEAGRCLPSGTCRAVGQCLLVQGCGFPIVSGCRMVGPGAGINLELRASLCARKGDFTCGGVALWKLYVQEIWHS
jgi:hypothetical protein